MLEAPCSEEQLPHETIGDLWVKSIKTMMGLMVADSCLCGCQKRYKKCTCQDFLLLFNVCIANAFIATMENQAYVLIFT